MPAEVDFAAGLIVFRVIVNVKETNSATTGISAPPSEQIQYLLLQKKEENRRHNWGPPKGFAKSGESDESASLRETREETGLTEKDLSVLTDFEIVLNYNAWRRKKRVRYWPARLIDLNKGDITISEEHNAYRWLPIKEAVNLAFGQDMKRELQRCHAYLKDLYGIDE